MLLELAEEHGIRDQVAELVHTKGRRAPQFTIPRMLSLAIKIEKITIQDMGKRTGLSKAQHHAILNGGSLTNSPLKTLQKIARGYRIPFVIVLAAARRSLHENNK